jgi:hypothetical protein
MKTYQAAGMEIYDFGGTSSDLSAVNFKMSFGGQLTTSRYALYARAGRAAWWLAHGLYVKWTGEDRKPLNASHISDGRINNDQPHNVD